MGQEQSLIYLDYAATAPLKAEVLEAMLPWMREEYGNASALYPLGQRARAAVEEARAELASVIGADEDEIYFTSGGTEADNWALIMGAHARKEKGRHIITTQIEHCAVLKTCSFLAENGFDVTYLPVRENGIVDPEELKAAVRDDTILISMMTANNEIGTIQPVREIGEFAQEKNILFHTDAVQAFCHLPIDVHADQIDMLAASGHKIGAQKGIGFLYLRKGVKIDAFVHGGSQERKMRGGTENVAGIAGLAKAAELAAGNFKKTTADVRSLRNQLITRILGEIPGTSLNGDRRNRLPNNVNMHFDGVDAETLLRRLGEQGICASGGSACASAGGSVRQSHVLTAIGCSPERIFESLRFTMGERTTMQDIDHTMRVLKTLVEEIRQEAGTKREYKGFVKWTLPC